ncbi:proton extrusion protein PcxA [Thermosynechococcaceae cyanobacterium BACA0444]|uniref:Proton extrusion protein PxcA n=1 Tax=Pseudocalidococcus azoricus BACA0444 TaxID=2918990 RepID=A0AAE4FS97_9CYAN|nr:proton extrusion protein PcxA [Pseudocalidococcus azoricus]MDS3861181.1 proton extrusion protein PcxA [Pseudocalidococcus azoricus BACA0444]
MFQKIRQFIKDSEHWYLSTPERALNASYTAALKIRAIENEHFGGRPISRLALSDGSEGTYFQAELQKLLKTVRMRLTEFKATHRILEIDAPASSVIFQGNLSNSQPVQNLDREASPATYTVTAEVINPDDVTIPAKLRFIDATLNRYKRLHDSELSALGTPSVSRQNPEQNGSGKKTSKSTAARTDPANLELGSFYESGYSNEDLTDDSKLDSGFIPRSILRTADRFRRELDPGDNNEEEIVRDFRTSKARTRIAIRFILLLIIIPLLTQQLSKILVIGPIVNHFKAVGKIEMIINTQIQERVLNELDQFENKIRFQSLISQVPVPPTELQEQLREKAIELSTEYQKELIEPLKNILSDSLGVSAFTLLLLLNRPQIAILKTFMDEVVYGLSDSAKAFIIILFTDVFVGFHSPHGWTVIVNNTLEHFGLPQNEDFIDMFIATFPVMLDTVFKYWIFRYLNQISPSAVATYKNMNE